MAFSLLKHTYTACPDLVKALQPFILDPETPKDREFVANNIRKKGEEIRWNKVIWSYRNNMQVKTIGEKNRWRKNR